MLVARRLPPTRIQILLKANRLGDSIAFKGPDSMPGDNWWDGFRKRHPTLRGKKANALPMDGARASVTQAAVAACNGQKPTKCSCNGFALPSLSLLSLASLQLQQPLSHLQQRAYGTQTSWVWVTISRVGPQTPPHRRSDNPNNPKCERIQPSSSWRTHHCHGVCQCGRISATTLLH